MFLLLASLWFVHPIPAEMPRAQSFLVKDNGVMRLEDRFDVRDLWTFQATLGAWEDDDGRVFILSKLDKMPPLITDTIPLTRTEYKGTRAQLEKKDVENRENAIARLSYIELPEKPRKAAIGVHNIKDINYYEGTNENMIVCAFLPEDSDVWYLANWRLLPEDKMDEKRKIFEKEFLGEWFELCKTEIKSELLKPEKKKKGHALKRENREIAKNKENYERSLLRIDAHHSVTNYQAWHVTDGDEFVVLDDLSLGNEFIVTITNDLKKMRAKYASVLKTPIDGSNVLAVARIFKDRDEYLDVVGDDMKWTAAYWNVSRRELVAYLPREGTDNLLRTIRHEAFHQYFAYACSMITTSPWINEGYAQYFEDEESLDWEIDKLGFGNALDFEKLSKLIPGLLVMDYETFYSGSDLERKLKYKLAWSIAVFLERGADQVRFQPFKNLKRDYFETLLKTQNCQSATISAFGSKDKMNEFVESWKKFWMGD